MIATALAKVAASIVQALAYHPQWQELAANDSKDCQAQIESGSATGNVAPSRHDHVEAEGDNEEDEEEPKKKRTVLDWPSTFLRFRRLVPLILLGKSRLSYALVGEPGSQTALQPLLTHTL